MLKEVQTLDVLIAYLFQVAEDENQTLEIRAFCLNLLIKVQRMK